jgi:hypothetical protein
LLVVDGKNYAIRRVNVNSGAVTTFAGTGDRGSEDGSALDAEFCDPTGIAIAPDGAVYVAEGAEHHIRVISPPAGDGTGRIVTTLIDNGAGDADGPFGVAQLSHIGRLTWNADGALLVPHCRNRRIRRVDLAAARVTSEPTRFAGLLTTTVAVGVDGASYYDDAISNCVCEVRGGHRHVLADQYALGLSPETPREHNLKRLHHRGVRHDASRHRLVVATGCRVLVIAFAGLAQQRAARALPLVLCWALVQRGRARPGPAAVSGVDRAAQEVCVCALAALSPSRRVGGYTIQCSG